MISFKTESIFGKGFKSGTRLTSCALSRLLAEGVLQLDGTMDASALGRLEKKDVWQYIYYLWYHNRETDDTFRAMSNPKVPARASALHFAQVVTRTVDTGSNASALSVSDLVAFVQWIHQQTRASPLKNPFLETIQRSVLQNLQRTGMPGMPPANGTDADAAPPAALDMPTYRIETHSTPYMTNTGDPGVRLSIRYKPVSLPETI